MGSYAIRVPDIGEGIAEVEVVAWHVKVGDAVAEDQTVAELMTDKATVEVPSPVSGKVTALGAEVGATIAVGADLLRLEVEGAGNVKGGAASASSAAAASAASSAAASSAASSASASSSSSAPPSSGSSSSGPSSSGSSSASTSAAGSSAAAASGPSSPGAAAAAATRGATPPGSPSGSSAASAASPAGSGASTTPSSRRAGQTSASGPSAAPALRDPGDKPLASPAVRRLALERGVELRFVRGTGPAGRILREDLLAWQGRQDAAPASGGAVTSAYAPREGETEIPVIGLRRRIAQKMQDAKRRIPHFSYVEEIDVTELESLRAVLNQRHAAGRGKLTLLPLIARAVVLAVRDFPQMNARYDDEATSGGAAGVVTRYGAVHLGIATQTDTGLMVPVLRHAEARDPWACAAEIARLAEAARTGRGSREELSGSTITITSLGPLGGIVTTPVINAPEVAIIGVNKLVERPVVRDGAIVVRKLMNLSSSFDHRVVDGMDAAAFIQAIRGLLETPALLFVE